MNRVFCVAGAAVVVSLPITPAMASPAQAAASLSGQYAGAIYADIEPRWEPTSYDSRLEPDSSCVVKVTQMPGGDVLSVDFLPDCTFNKAARVALEDAVRDASPLPYNGFESVFQREIRLTFHAASLAARQAQVANQAATARVRKNAAEADSRWDARVGTPRQRYEYAHQCSFHLAWDMPRIRVQPPVSVVVTVDRSGKVVSVAGSTQEAVDGRLVAALRATPPCDPVPADLAVGKKTIEIGPIVIGNGG